jgi:hypothetical protein
MLFTLIFSKDRPFQLQECLRTCLKYVCTSSDEIVRYYVLFTSSDDRTRELYGHVAIAYPGVTFVDETEFGADFQRILDGMVALAGVQPALIMLLVDDALFVSSVPVGDAAALLLRPGVAVYHCKLHPGVWYSHPASCICEPPQLVPAGASSVMFELLGSSGDWCYPWDLCGSIYLLSTVLSMVQQLRVTDPEALGHPNKLEQRGHKLWHGTRSWPGATPDVTLLAACPLAPTLVVVTVNRVQDVFSNAVYASGEHHSLSALNELVLSSTHFLDDLYAQSTFPCVHIGILRLSNAALCEPALLQLDAPPLVSVLIPAFNAGRHVRAALVSVLSQQGLAPEQGTLILV